MDEPALVQRVETGGDVVREPQHVLQRQRAVALDALLERLPGDVRDCEVRATVDVPGVENRNEALVGDLCGAACFVNETSLVRVVLGEIDLQQLQRDLRAVTFAYRSEDEAHPALAQERLEPVRPEGVPDRELWRAAREVPRHRGVAEPARPWPLGKR